MLAQAPSLYVCQSVCLESMWAAKWPVAVCLAGVLHGQHVCVAIQTLVLQGMLDDCRAFCCRKLMRGQLPDSRHNLADMRSTLHLTLVHGVQDLS